MKRALIGILKALLPLVIVAAAGLGAITMIMNRPPVEILTPVVEPPGVRVHEVTLEDAPLAVTSQGTVQPRTESQLVPEIAGRVTWVAPSFAEGGFFEAGDVLVRIDPFDYEQMLVSARSQLAQARLRLAQEEAEAEVALREWDTLGRGDPRELALRKPQLEDARASVAAAEASVERATRDLERAEIVSPYAGRVRTKNVDIGQYVRVGDTLATVYAVDVAEIRLPLPDDELAYLDLPLSYRGVERQAQPDVTLRATFAGETHVWTGLIVRTESEIDSVSRMVHAIAEVVDPYAPGPNPNRPPLAVGMYVEAEIGGRTARDVAVLPRPALRGRDQVLVVTPEDRLSFRTIDVLRTSTESVIVRGGLQAGELVVISPLDTPTDGMRVQLADADPGLIERRAGGAVPRTPSTDAEPLREGAAAVAARDTLREPAGAPAGVAPLMAPAPAGTAPPGRPRAVTSTPAQSSRVESATAAQPPSAAAVATARPAPAEAVAAASPPTDDAASGMAAAAGRPVRPPWLESLLQDDRPAEGRPLSRRTRSAAPAPARDGGGPAAEAGRTAARNRVVPGARSATARPAAIEPGAGPAARRPAGREPRGLPMAARPAAPGPAVEPAARPGAPAAGTAPPPGPSAVAPGATPNGVAVASFADLNRVTGEPGIGPALSRAVASRLAAADGIAVAAHESDARYVVRGGVQQVGPLVRVTARIVDTVDGAVLHAAKIDGTTDDRPALEADVAAVVVDRLAASPAAIAPAATGGMRAGDAATGGMRGGDAPAGSMPSALAVLPFDDLSAGVAPALDFDLGAALTEAVAARLAGLPAVTVVAPGADAAWAVGGGIQRIGPLVRVTARLTDVRSGAVVTAFKVDGRVEALADLRSRVAAAMIESVREALAGESAAGFDPGIAAAPRQEGRRS